MTGEDISDSAKWLKAVLNRLNASAGNWKVRMADFGGRRIELVTTVEKRGGNASAMLFRSYAENVGRDLPAKEGDTIVLIMVVAKGKEIHAPLFY